MPTDTISTIRNGANSKKQTEKCSPKNAGNSNIPTASTPSREPLSNQSGSATTRSQSIDKIKSCIDTIQNDIWEGDQSINTKLKQVSKQSESNYDDISYLRQENAQLRRELELHVLRSVVIRMDRRMIAVENDVTDLRDRSMRDNILIHNFPYTPNEDLATTMPVIFKQSLGVDVEFVRIHRNGIRPQHNSDRPITITAKLTDRNKIHVILNAQKQKTIAKQSLPFFITTQQPASVVAARNRLYDTADSLRKQNISAKIKKNNIILPNGLSYKDDVPFVSNAGALMVTPEETEILVSVTTKSSEPVKKVAQNSWQSVRQSTL